MRTYFSGHARPALLAAVVGLAWLVSGPAARAQETPPPAPAPPAAPVPSAPPAIVPLNAPLPAAAPSKVDPEARALLVQMVKAHQALTSFSATMDFAVQQGGKTTKQQAKIAYQKPNKARVTTNNPTNGAAVLTVSNGTSLFQTVSTEKTGYHKAAAPPDAKAIAQVIGASKAAGVGLFPLLATEPSIIDEIVPPGTASLVHSPDETINGALSDVVTGTFSPAPTTQVTLTFAMGKTDHLLRRLSISQVGGDAPNLSETYSGVQANPTLPPSTFAFVPAPGMKEIKEKPTGSAAPSPQGRLKKGASPIPVSGSDITGKPVSLAAYKGKVVLLDFWATWCPPCREEVPNIVRTYNKYHGGGFEIVGVSLDQPGDKAKLVSYTKENKMPWRQIFDAANNENAVSRAYGVNSIPFAVLIGRDGKVLAIGDSLRGEALEPAIKAALAAK